MGQLCLKHGEHIRQHPDEVPVIELQMGSYKHVEYGEIRFPILKIVGRISAKNLPPIEASGGQQQLEAPDDDGGGNDAGGNDAGLFM